MTTETRYVVAAYWPDASGRLRLATYRKIRRHMSAALELASPGSQKWFWHQRHIGMPGTDYAEFGPGWELRGETV